MRKLKSFDFICENCGKKDQRISRAAGPPRFCSKSCSNSWQHAQGLRKAYCSEKSTLEWWKEKLTPEEFDIKLDSFKKRMSELHTGKTWGERFGVENSNAMHGLASRSYDEKFGIERSKSIRQVQSEKCGWKGKSLEERFTPERANEIRKMAGSKNKGTRRSEETKKKMSESMHKRMIENPESFHSYGIKGWYRGFFFRSACEYFFMKKLEREGIDLMNDVKYESFRIPFEFDGVARTYIPDFYVKSRATVYEVKYSFSSESDSIIEVKKKAAIDFLRSQNISYKMVQASELEIPDGSSFFDIAKSDDAVFLMNSGQSDCDMLASMFDEQIKFMKLLQQKRKFAEFPVDLKTKTGQKFVKDISHECMHEMFEAIHLLSDSKDHRNSMSNDFDKDKFLEEMSDALHYYVEVCALVGITSEELFKAYMKKSTINFWRISSGY